MSAEISPLGLHSFLHNIIDLHGISEFYCRVLDDGLGDTDKASINFTKDYKLLQHMVHHLPSPPTNNVLQQTGYWTALAGSSEKIPLRLRIPTAAQPPKSSKATQAK